MTKGSKKVSSKWDVQFKSLKAYNPSILYIYEFVPLDLYSKCLERLSLDQSKYDFISVINLS